MYLFWSVRRPAPRLKEADLPTSPSLLLSLYHELCTIMRTIYHQCRLVHADLSEYNILFVLDFLSFPALSYLCSLAFNRQAFLLFYLACQVF